MSSGIPGKIIVNEFSLMNNIGGKDSTKTNIWPMISTMSIYESIFRNNMYGVAQVQDTYNLYSTLPITSDTYVRISMLDPTTGQNVRSIFRVYKISNIQQTSTKMQSYLLHFVSDEMFNSQALRVTKRVVGNIPSEVEEIHKKISTKPIEITPDAAKTNIYLPYLTADQSIKLLVDNAKWGSRIPDYCYWETFRGYNCKSLSACLLQNPIHDFSTNVKFTTKPYDSFDYADFTKINDLQQNRAFDGIGSLYAGYDGATIYTYDPIAGQPNAYQTGTSYLSRIYNFPATSLDYSALSTRMQLLRGISQSYYYISVPGLLSRSAGDNANVTVYNGNYLNVKDTTLSGRRLICGIVHVISVDEYHQHITLGDYYQGN